jgi:hypothetical protein
MQPDFDKANEIYFRLGIIYKQQQKFVASLDVCHTSLQHLSVLANVITSAFVTLSMIRPSLSARRTSGSRLVMSTNSKRM